jgi:hypothetical protein
MMDAKKALKICPFLHMVAMQSSTLPAARDDLHINWKAWRVLCGPGDKLQTDLAPL